MSSEVRSEVERWRMGVREALRLFPGGITDLSDVLKVARNKAKTKFGWQGVRVLPWVDATPDGCYIVLVEPKSPPEDVVGEPAGEAGAQGDDGAADVQARDVAGPRQKTGEKPR